MLSRRLTLTLDNLTIIIVVGFLYYFFSLLFKVFLFFSLLLWLGNVRIESPEKEVSFFVSIIMIPHIILSFEFATAEDTEIVFGVLRESHSSFNTRARLMSVEVLLAKVSPASLTLQVVTT